MRKLLLLAAILLTAGRAEAGPLDWIKHHKRFLLMEGAAIGAASIHAYGLHHCRSTGSVERCQSSYGAAWASWGIISGMNIIVMPTLAESCWREDGGKFCYIPAYGGSAGQLGFGISQWRKEKHVETDLRILTRH
jgi:hypothetical protein